MLLCRHRCTVAKQVPVIVASCWTSKQCTTGVYFLLQQTTANLPWLIVSKTSRAPSPCRQIDAVLSVQPPGFNRQESVFCASSNLCSLPRRRLAGVISRLLLVWWSEFHSAISPLKICQSDKVIAGCNLWNFDIKTKHTVGVSTDGGWQRRLVPDLMVTIPAPLNYEPLLLSDSNS